MIKFPWLFTSHFKKIQILGLLEINLGNDFGKYNHQGIYFWIQFLNALFGNQQNTFLEQVLNPLENPFLKRKLRKSTPVCECHQGVYLFIYLFILELSSLFFGGMCLWC